MCSYLNYKYVCKEFSVTEYGISKEIYVKYDYLGVSNANSRHYPVYLFTYPDT